MLKLNNKNAEAYTTTNSKILDLFCYNKRMRIATNNYDEFKELINMIISAKNENLELFIKLLKFHRLINNGNGIKNIYHLCLMVLRIEEPEIYKDVLKWSYEYCKDILRMDRINNMIKDKHNFNNTRIILNTPGYYKSQSKNRNNKRLVIFNKQKRNFINDDDYNDKDINIKDKYEYNLTPEEEIYSDLIYKNIRNIILEKDDKINMMIFKYLSYETGHFSIETEIILQRVEDLINNDEELKNVIFN